jgi:hypothetical protein
MIKNHSEENLGRLEPRGRVQKYPQAPHLPMMFVSHKRMIWDCMDLLCFTEVKWRRFETVYVRACMLELPYWDKFDTRQALRD